FISGGHFTFGYFVARYGLQYVAAYEGFAPNAEPGPRAITGLIDKLKALGTGYVYYDELLDPKVSRVISQETGAKIALLHAGHNVSKDELKRGVTFLEIMEENLKNLKAGLACS
ncbi:MAG: zinc ABC transporter substrate-binding protein, partial [Nitrospirae bacterium]|nr:zinc ABC transporter substrate-binding protein [Nitrospirota bacterium]